MFRIYSFTLGPLLLALTALVLWYLAKTRALTSILISILLIFLRPVAWVHEKYMNWKGYEWNELEEVWSTNDA